MNVTAQSRLQLYPLLMAQEESGSWIVGRADADQFAEMPAEGVTFLRALQENESVENAGKRVELEHGEIVDAFDFIREVASLGFIESVEGVRTETAARPPSLAWLAPQHVRWVFRGPALACVAAFVATGCAVAIARHDLVPGYHAFFITSSPSVNLAWNLAMLLVVTAAHEFWHLASARAEGVQARIGLGTRLQFLVAQTTVSGLWLLPRRIRLRVYLAGVISDLVLLSCCYLALSQVPSSGTAHRLLEALIVGLVIGIALQFAVYMRTDIYFVLQELLKCKNLYSDAVRYVRYVMSVPLAAVSDRPRLPDPTRELPAHERGPVRLYSVLMAGGSAVSLVFFACYEAPIVVTLLAEALQHVARGVSAGRPEKIADGAVALLIQAAYLAAFAKLALAKHGPKLRRACSGRRSPPLARQ